MSDHISGPRALADPIADITDVYAFPSPERPGHLVLVMNTLPFAKPSDLLSEGLIYRFRLRPLTPREPDEPAPFAARAEEFAFDCVFSPPDEPRRAGRDLHHPGGRNDRVPRERRRRRLRAWRSRLRRPALGPVHHGRPRGAEDDRDGAIGVHRSRVDLPRRQERPQPGDRDRRRAPGRRVAGRRRRRDANARQAQRSHRTRRAPGGEEHDAGAEAVRSGQPRPRDPRPLQHGGRIPPRGRLPGCIPGATERQPRLLGRSRREGRLVHRRTTAAIP